jgi:predicted nucleic acid-binding protein
LKKSRKDSEEKTDFILQKLIQKLIMYLVDTNIISFLQRKNQEVINNFLRIDPQRIFLSSAVWYELQYGILNDPSPARSKK